MALNNQGPSQSHLGVFSDTKLPTGNDVDEVTTEYEVRFGWDNFYASHPIIIPATMNRSMSRIWEAIKNQLPAFARSLSDTPHTRLHFVAQETVWERYYMQFDWNETGKFRRWYTRNTKPYLARARIRIDIRTSPVNIVERVEDGWRMSTAKRIRLQERLRYFPGDGNEVLADEWGNFYEVEDPKPVVHVEGKEGDDGEVGNDTMEDDDDDDDMEDDDDDNDDNNKVVDGDIAPSTLKWLRG